MENYPMNLKELAELAIAEDAAQDTALDVALEYLVNEPTPPPRCRFPKVKMAFEVRGKSAATPVEDEAAPLTDLQKHDNRFHPKGYKKGDACKYRDEMAKGDHTDASLAAAERTEHTAKYGNLSVRKRDEYFRLMTKKHPELDAEVVLAEIGKIADPKVQKDAFAWVMRGAVKLPEDLYKVEQARELARKAKKDPLSYDTPQACINDLLGHGHKVSLKPITVEELKKDPLFSDYKKLPYGVETFQVEDSKAGQMRMREVIDTHWGKDANPWCLLARNNRDATYDFADWMEKQFGSMSEAEVAYRDSPKKWQEKYERETGKSALEPLEKAWTYWNHYNALPKRVAFMDGDLLAFMATDGESDLDYKDADIAEWLEKAHPDVNSDFLASGEIGTYSFLCTRYPDIANEAYKVFGGVKEEWWDRQDSSHKGIPIGEKPVPGDKFGRSAQYEIIDEKPVQKGNYIKRTSSGNVLRTRDTGTAEEETMTVHFDMEDEAPRGYFRGFYFPNRNRGLISYGDTGGPDAKSGWISFVDGKMEERGVYPGTTSEPENIDEIAEEAERLYKKYTSMLMEGTQDASPFSPAAFIKYLKGSTTHS